MNRTRPDGNKFQEEVKKGLEKLSVPTYQVRLHTTSVSAISDFIIFSKRIAILEVKETSQNSFSTRTMQQREMAEKFQNFHHQATQIYGELPYRLYVLVHFITPDLYTVCDLTEELAIIHPSDDSCFTSSSLREVLLYVLGEQE